MNRPVPTLLRGAMALVLASGTALAQAPAPAAADPEALAEARKELARAARRVAELSGVSTDARPRVQVQKHVIRRPVVGVLLAPDDASGVRIAGVTPDGPAAKAGLRAGDRLVSIDGSTLLGQEPRQRVENARGLLAGIDSKRAVRLGIDRDGRRIEASVVPRLDQAMFVWKDGDGGFDFDLDADIEAARHAAVLPAGVAPQVRRELIRIGREGACTGGDCGYAVLSEAFRWQGLNLAAVDASLGRYFGTERGVLVLSAGKELAGLQAGDVIRSIDGKPVASPREAMALLRGKPADAKVAIDYLRDRKAATAQLTVPKSRPFNVPAPPPPPAPPARPAPPAPPAPPPASQARPPAPPPPPAPAHPMAGRVAPAPNPAHAGVDSFGPHVVAPLPPPPPVAYLPGEVDELLRMD